MDVVLPAVAVSIGFVAAVWVPVGWAYLFAKLKGLAKPGWFAFSSGCLGYGFHILVGAMVAVPMEVFLVKVAPSHCLYTQNSQLCSAYDFLDEWGAAFGLIVLFIVAVLSPFVVNKYVWSRIGDH